MVMSMNFTASQENIFGRHVHQHSCLTCHHCIKSEVGRFFAMPQAELCLYCYDRLLTLIDSAGKELSNGYHIVFWSNFDI